MREGQPWFPTLQPTAFPWHRSQCTLHWLVLKSCARQYNSDEKLSSIILYELWMWHFYNSSRIIFPLGNPRQCSMVHWIRGEVRGKKSYKRCTLLKRSGLYSCLCNLQIQWLIVRQTHLFFFSINYLLSSLMSNEEQQSSSDWVKPNKGIVNSESDIFMSLWQYPFCVVSPKNKHKGALFEKLGDHQLLSLLFF